MDAYSRSSGQAFYSIQCQGMCYEPLFLNIFLIRFIVDECGCFANPYLFVVLYNFLLPLCTCVLPLKGLGSVRDIFERIVSTRLHLYNLKTI